MQEAPMQEAPMQEAPMDRDDRTADTGMLGSDAENPGPGRDIRQDRPRPRRHTRCGRSGDHHGHVRHRP